MKAVEQVGRHNPKIVHKNLGLVHVNYFIEIYTNSAYISPLQFHTERLGRVHNRMPTNIITNSMMYSSDHVE